LRARPKPTPLKHLSDASFLGKLLVLPANVRLDWKVISRYEHSSLFGLIISNKGKSLITLTPEHPEVPPACGKLECWQVCEEPPLGGQPLHDQFDGCISLFNLFPHLSCSHTLRIMFTNVNYFN